MWWDPAGTAGIRLMAILQFVLWTAPERPSLKWKRDTCSHRLEGCSHISTTCVCLPDYDLPFQPQETNSFVAGVLVHKRGSHHHQMTSYSSKSSVMREKCQSDCEQLQPQLKNQPYCHRLQLWCSCYIKSVLHILNIAKKKEDLSSPRDVVLVLFFLYVSLYLSDGEAQLLLTIRTALKVQGKLESMPEGAGRDPNGGNQGMDGAKQVVLAGGMSPCSHVPNPWHRWRWSHHQGW